MQTYTALFEHNVLDSQRFWYFATVPTPKENKKPTITPPHYGNSIEFVLTKDIEGFANINGYNFKIENKCAFYVPPNQVHSFTYLKGDGFIICFKIDQNSLKSYIDLSKFLFDEACDFTSFNNKCANFDYIYENIIEIKDKLNIFVAAKCILNIFEDMIANSTKSFLNTTLLLDNTAQPEFLYKCIEYTNKNLLTANMADISKAMGYNTNYFCSKFKKMSGGINYIDYLNTVKLSNACELLSKGNTITTACYSSGFNNISYFIKMFKKHLGVSPLQFKSQVLNAK